VIQNDDRLRIGTVPLGGSLIRTDALEGAVLGGGKTHLVPTAPLRRLIFTTRPQAVRSSSRSRSTCWRLDWPRRRVELTGDIGR